MKTKRFVKATMETHMQSPDLSGKPGYGGIQFPVKTTFCEEGRFTAEEIRTRVERAVEAWDCEVATLGGDDPNSIVTEAMKRPGEYWFSQNGYKEENPMLFWEGVDGMLYVSWDDKGYAIIIYSENPYMEAGEIISASASDGEKVFVTAYQDEEEISFETCVVAGKKEFYNEFIKELPKYRYLDWLDDDEASAARNLIGGNVLCHLEKFTEFDERWEMLNAEKAFGMMFTEGPSCFAVMCVPVAEAEK